MQTPKGYILHLYWTLISTYIITKNKSLKIFMHAFSSAITSLLGLHIFLSEILIPSCIETFVVRRFGINGCNF